MRILYDAGAGGDAGGANAGAAAGAGGAGGAAGGSAGGAPWYSVLPADLQLEASIRTIPDVATLAKSYVSAQKMVGADKVVLPGKNATPEQWSDFYNKVGRPTDPQAYTQSQELKLHEGLKLETERLAEIKKEFHKLGLTTQQGSALLNYYLTNVNSDFTKAMDAQTAAAATTTQSLKAEWGDKFDANLDIAKAVVRKFGTAELLQEIESTNIGNNPHLIKFLLNTGRMMMEDNPLEHGKGLVLTTQTQAVEEIGRLKYDAEFQKALNSASAPGHREAVAKWQNLFAQAYPGKVGEQ